MFQQGNITVDDRFVRFGNKSFAINKITSVDVREDTPKASNNYVIWWAIAAFLLFAGLTGSVNSGESAWPLILFGALAAFAGWRSWLKRSPPTIYRLFLVTAASETQAFVTFDREEMYGLRDAIEDAMSRST